jgi:acyl-CoA synthetase (AMP-forming)/AMP-acid ligase II
MTPAPMRMPSLPPPRRPALRRERHFGDRVMQCFAQRPGSVAQMLADAVTRNGAGEALVCGDERLTWRQLDTLCSRLAGGLQAHGIATGDRVALLLDNGAPPATIMPADEESAHGDSVGRAVACGELAVMDASGREFPTGDSGEVWIKGPMVVPGYWNNASATAESFVGGYWRSGDLGRLDADGFLCLHDRLKDVINRGGYKVYSAEVEGVLAEHPAVLEAAVIGTPCAVLGERVHAFVALRDAGSDVSLDELACFSRARLSDYKVPEGWTLQDQPLPRNANGKLMKRVLREQLARSLSAEQVE